jgi:hypothetical protein
MALSMVIDLTAKSYFRFGLFQRPAITSASLVLKIASNIAASAASLGSSPVPSHAGHVSTMITPLHAQP